MLRTFSATAFARQQQRAERAREQQERDDPDQRDHQREVAVDGLDEVVVQGQVAPRRGRRDRRHARLRARGRACRATSEVAPSAVGKASTIAVPSCRHRSPERRRRGCRRDRAGPARPAPGSCPRSAPRAAAARRRRCRSPSAPRGRPSRRPAWRSCRGRTGRAGGSRPRPPARPRWRRTRPPRASGGARHPRPSASMPGSPCRRCAGAASRAARPTFASTTGSSVIATAVLTSGISMPPYPTLRRKGRGSATSASRPIATVVPLNTTARPDVSIARWIASSPVRPCASSSRQRTTISSA